MDRVGFRQLNPTYWLIVPMLCVGTFFSTLCVLFSCGGMTQSV